MLDVYQVSDLPDRIAQKITIDPDTGCWLWTAATGNNGYGLVRWSGRMVMAHRLTYHLLADRLLVLSPGRGSERTIDHLCRVRACVHPAHLEVVNQRENSWRGALLVNHSSKFLGVSRDSKKWGVKIWSIGRQHYLGSFPDEATAAVVYDDACEALGEGRPNEERGLFDGWGEGA